MLMNAETLKGYKLLSLDGEIGKVKDFYFDDQHWAVRYLVVDTGAWLTGKQVLISPYALREVLKVSQDIVIDLTKKKIEESPSLESDKPVSQQFEESYYGYYGWPAYWSGGFMWGAYPYIVRDLEKWQNPYRPEKAWDLHLRSIHNVSGYHLQATDGEMGHIEDFIIDVDAWAIRYLVVNTKNWWPGKKVLISPKWIEQVSWSEEKAFVNLSRETIKHSKEYIEGVPPTRDYEIDLHRHYRREGYWISEKASNEKRDLYDEL